MTGEQRRILVVEDDALVRSALVMNLQDFGFAVTEAATVAEALAAADDGGAALKPAIVDMGLPDGSGDGLVAELRTRLPGLPVIIATGRGPDELQQRQLDDLLVVLVPKPYEIERIVLAVERLRGPGR